MYMGCGRDWFGMGHWSALDMEVHVEKGGVHIYIYIYIHIYIYIYIYTHTHIYTYDTPFVSVRTFNNWEFYLNVLGYIDNDHNVHKTERN